MLTAGLLLMLMAVQNAGPARAAAFAEGVRGVFTAERVECVRHPGHESCSWLGDFRSDDGTVRRDAIALYGSDREMFEPGAVTPAFDTGRRGHVYGPGGSNEWVAVAGLFLLGLTMAAWPVVRAARAREGRFRPDLSRHPG